MKIQDMYVGGHYGVMTDAKAAEIEMVHNVKHTEHVLDTFVDRFHYVHTNCMDCDFGVTVKLQF